MRPAQWPYKLIFITSNKTALSNYYILKAFKNVAAAANTTVGEASSMTKILIKAAAVTAACAVCATAFSSCSKRGGPAAKIINSGVMPSAAAPVSSNPAAGSSAVSALVSSNKAAMSSKSGSDSSAAAVRNADSSSNGAGFVSVSRAVDARPIVKGMPGRMGGVCEFIYYRYYTDYYRNMGARPSIQNNIEKGLYGDFYQIKGVDPQKSVAMFINRYYHELDYAFPDSITYNGKSYLINANNGMSPDTSLGKAGGYNIYRLKGFDPSMELGVEIAPGHISAAFRLDSVVNLNGTSYQVEPSLSEIPKGEKLKALGKAHGETAAYDAYYDGDTKNTAVVVLYVNNTYETTAVAISSNAGPLPQTYSGTPFESMYMVDATVQWPGHGFYYCDPQSEDQKYNSTAAQAAIKKQLGAFLGNYQPDANSSYPMYVIKGIDPAKKIMVQNNQVYLAYDYIFPDTVTYNGHTYRAGGVDGKENGDTIDGIRAIRGGAIGMAGPYKVYAIKKIDPSKAIVVMMKGSAANVVSTATTITFFRIQ